MGTMTISILCMLGKLANGDSDIGSYVSAIIDTVLFSLILASMFLVTLLCTQRLLINIAIMYSSLINTHFHLLKILALDILALDISGLDI